MKKIIAVGILLVIVMSVFCGAILSSVSADENYQDNSNEYSTGPGDAPDQGMARDEPRTRFKDR